MPDGVSRRPGIALALAITAWCAAVLATIVLVLGPVSLPAVGFSISRASRPFWVFAVSLGLAIGLRPPKLLLRDLGSSSSPYVATLGLVLALTGGLLVARGSVSVGGADSAGYLAQAKRWYAHTVLVPLPIALPDVPASAWVQSGLGFRSDPTGTATVPSYPPGLPWLQALALRVGGESAAVRAVPLASALLALLATYFLARLHAAPAAATLAVALLASTPAFLFQALQPMSDVPALAAWLLALALASRAGVPGIAASALSVIIAILVRPNLALLVLAVCWQATMAGTSRRARLYRASLIAVAGALAIGVIAVVQASLYGSPLQSGYGSASDLFSSSYVISNTTRYATWLVQSVSTLALAGIAAGTAYAIARAVSAQPMRPAVVMATLTVASYLVYVPFDSWTYLRFLLIALAVACVGAAVLFDRLLSRLAPAWRAPIFCAVVLLVAVPNLQLAQALGVFGIRAQEYRYQAAGEFVRDRLPSSVVILAAQHSASAPYYSGRPVLRADLLDAVTLDTIATWSAREHRPLAFVLDSAEVERLRERLGGVSLAALDWPPRAEIGRPVTTRIWLAADRDAYRSGASIRTMRIVTIPD